MWETVGTDLSAIVALVVLVASWLHSRRSDLRREEVFVWANESIRVLQTLALLCGKPQGSQDDSDEIAALSIPASVLLERGRLLFRNEKWGTYGIEKEPAYRGLRPAILDELLVCHELAREWASLTIEERARAAIVAAACERRFVSLAQLEVGRQRTASLYTSRGGHGVSFKALLNGSAREPIVEPSHTWWKWGPSL